MTTPQQPTTAQSPQQLQGQASAVASLAAVIAASLAVQFTAQGVLAAVMAPAGALASVNMLKIERNALMAAIEVVMSMPPEAHGISGPASRQVARLNLLRRAQFAVAAARRITVDLKQARSQGTPLMQALQAAIARERRYFGMHTDAIWQRKQAAAQADSAYLSYGRLLGWHTVMDKRTSAECRAANGRNFNADQMPLIGYPGGVHPHCRCYPGAPWPGGRMLPSAR